MIPLVFLRETNRLSVAARGCGHSSSSSSQSNSRLAQSGQNTLTPPFSSRYDRHRSSRSSQGRPQLPQVISDSNSAGAIIPRLPVAGNWGRSHEALKLAVDFLADELLEFRAVRCDELELMNGSNPLPRMHTHHQR
jgi:hypothetical protein